MTMNRYPDLILNAYIWEQFRLNKNSIYTIYSNRVPFFPITDAEAGAQTWKNQTYVLYDSFTRNRSGYFKGFYPRKSGQTTYAIRGSVSSVYEWRDFIIDVLDRDDVAAQDVNSFAASKYGNLNGIYFECIYPYQTLSLDQTTRPDSIKQQYIAQIIVRYDYHPESIYKENT